jgi:hypothetical protein
MVLAESQRENPIEAPQGGSSLTELEERLTQSREGFLVVRVEPQCLFEAVSPPGIFFPREPGVRHAHVEVDRERINVQAIVQDVESLVIPALVVETMGPFAIVV